MAQASSTRGCGGRSGVRQGCTSGGGGVLSFPLGGGGSEWGQGGQWGKLKGDGVGVWGMLWTYKPHSSPSLRDTPPPGAETPPPLQDRDPPPEAKTPPFAIIGTPPKLGPSP